jgi:hypothetical protein
MSKSSVITTNKFAETKESISQSNPNQNNLNQQQHQQQKTKQENKKEKHHNRNENLQEEKERNATTNNNKTAKLQKINNHNKSDSSICCHNTIQIIEIESKPNDKLLSQYDHMIPYIDDDDIGHDHVVADAETLEMGGVDSELNQEHAHELNRLTCHLRNEHGRNNVVNINYNDSSLSMNNNNNNKDSYYNNNKKLIMNSNLNYENCNKNNSMKADLNNCKISTSEQLKKQFMNVDVTKPNRLLQQTTLAGIDDQDINGVSNATSSVQMKRNYINKQQQPFDGNSLVLNNGELDFFFKLFMCTW